MVRLYAVFKIVKTQVGRKVVNLAPHKYATSKFVWKSETEGDDAKVVEDANVASADVLSSRVTHPPL